MALPLTRPVPFQFVDGGSFASNGGFQWNIPALLANTGLGEGLASAGKSIGEGITISAQMRARKDEAEENRLARAEEGNLDRLARVEAANLKNASSPLTDARLESVILGNQMLTQKLSDLQIPDSQSWVEGPLPVSDSGSSTPVGGVPSVDVNVPPIADGTVNVNQGMPIPKGMEGKSGVISETVVPVEPPSPILPVGKLSTLPPLPPAVETPGATGVPVVSPQPLAKPTPVRTQISQGLYTEEATLPDGSTVFQFVDKRGKRIGNITKTPAPPPPGLLSDAQLTEVNRITGKYNADPFIKRAQDAVAEIGNFTAAIQQKNGAGDIAAINAFQRMVDPGVAVREGDIALIQQAIPRLQRFGLKVANWFVGDQLSPEARSQLDKLAKDLYATRVKNANEKSIPRFMKVAKAARIPFEYIGETFETNAPGFMPASGGLSVITSQQDYDALPSGTSFVDVNGTPGRKP
tara:strand:- start:20257 stop:21651 length:1395 start_codon:yes stop_codon:yes gene_type:complete